MIASSTALATMIATDSLNINTSATSSGCSVQIPTQNTSHTSSISDSGYLDIMQCNVIESLVSLTRNVWNFSKAIGSLHWGILSLTVHLVISSDSLIPIGSQGTVFFITLRVKMVLYVYCYFFWPNDSGALISSPLSDWKNIGHLLQKHVGDVHTSLHSAAAEHAETFNSVASGQ